MVKRARNGCQVAVRKGNLPTELAVMLATAGWKSAVMLSNTAQMPRVQTRSRDADRTRGQPDEQSARSGLKATSMRPRLRTVCVERAAADTDGRGTLSARSWSGWGGREQHPLWQFPY
jgi:hypothetical protein